MKSNILRVLPVAFILVLGGCSLFGGNGDTGNKITPATTVYSVHAAYNAALVAAVTYARLPRCARTTATICSKQSIVDKIRAADNIAAAALEFSQQVVRNSSSDAAAKERARAKAFEAIGALKYVLTSNGITLKEVQ